jgi:hypothetical protein
MKHRPSRARKASRALVALALGATGAAGYLLGWRRHWSEPVSKMPLPSGPPAFDPTTIEQVPLVALEAGSVDAFVSWVARTPGSGVQAVRDAIAAAHADGDVRDALIASLFNLPVRDIGQHLLLLSIVGEMRQPAFVEPLVKFIGLSPDSIAGGVENAAGCRCGACMSHLDAAAMLKARAVEMLAWLRTSEALEAVLGFARYHESRVVRLAALDAYTYNHADSPDAIARARASARRDEAPLVGLPRFTRDSNPAEFARSVAAFYEQYPEERPRPPHVAGRPGHRIPEQRSSR